MNFLPITNMIAQDFGLFADMEFRSLPHSCLSEPAVSRRRTIASYHIGDKSTEQFFLGGVEFGVAQIAAAVQVGQLGKSIGEDNA